MYTFIYKYTHRYKYIYIYISMNTYIHIYTYYMYFLIEVSDALGDACVSSDLFFIHFSLRGRRCVRWCFLIELLNNVFSDVFA